MKSLRLLHLPIVCLATALLPDQAHSSVVIDEPFSAPLNGVPAGWSAVIRNSAENNGAAEVQSIPGVSENALRFHRAANGSSGNFSANANAAVYYTAPGSTSLKDFDAEVTFRLGAAFGNSSTAGFIVRAQSASYQFSGTSFASYYIALSTDGLGIYQNPTNNSVPGTLVSQLSSFTAAADQDYLFRFSANGTDLSAALLDVTGTTTHASVTYTSAVDVGGLFGLRSGFGNYSSTAYFRDLTVTVIPEPSSLILAVLGGGWLLVRRKSFNPSIS